MYSEASDISFHNFKARTEMDDFEILEWLDNIRPSTVDTEQMFSRLSINFLQNSVSTASHSRNVFVNRNLLFSRK